MAGQRGLGKGLGALLGEAAVQQADTPGGAVQLPLQKVEPNPAQPRHRFDEEALAELADSIRLHGIIQPLTVRKLPSGYYQIIAGERRWRAARMAGLTEVPVVVIEADDREAMELALIENLQRADLDPIEEAMGYRQLMDEYGMTQSAAAERVGRSRPAVANALRLLALPDEIVTMVQEGGISAGHARAILTLADAPSQIAVAQRVQNLQLSVRQTELMCRNMAKGGKKPPAPKPAVDYIAVCERDLSKSLGRGVKIHHGKRKGRVELEYYGEDDLQRLLDSLQASDGKERRG